MTIFTWDIVFADIVFKLFVSDSIAYSWKDIGERYLYLWGARILVFPIVLIVVKVFKRFTGYTLVYSDGHSEDSGDGPAIIAGVLSLLGIVFLVELPSVIDDLVPAGIWSIIAKVVAYGILIIAALAVLIFFIFRLVQSFLDRPVLTVIVIVGGLVALIYFDYNALLPIVNIVESIKALFAT